MNALVHNMGGDGSLPTMSSREIADLCGTRHNQVVETIVRLFDKGVLRESRKTTRAYAPEGGGRPTQVYDLTKRDTLVVVSGYDDELRAKIIDRWQELETRPAQPTSIDVRNLPQLQTIALQLIEVNREQQDQIAAMAPKVEAFELLEASEGSLTFTQTAKLLGVNRDVLTRRMSAEGWIYRQNGSWVAYKQHILNGRLEYKEHSYTDSGTGMRCCKPYCHITPKGLAKLAILFGVTTEAAA